MRAYNFDITLSVPPMRRGLLGRMISVWFERWWWAVILVGVVPVALALIVDVRWWYVAFMVMLMVYPTAMWLAYAYYGTQPGASLMTCRKYVAISNGVMAIDYYRIKVSEGKDDNGASEEEFIVSRDVVLTDVEGFSFDSSKMTIEWGKGVWEYIEIPADVFPCGEDARRLAQYLYDIIDAKRANRR